MRMDSGATILLVDDEDRIVDFIKDALEDEGYAVVTATDGERALEVARRKDPDLVILDIMMPKVDGYTVCRVLREDMDIPILLLSAKQSDVDKVLGFSMGADDYVMKPFSIKELLARVEAHLRRQRRSRPEREKLAVLSFGGLTVDLDAHEVRYLGAPIPMTRKEFEIVELLALHPRQVFSRERLYSRIWDLEATGYTDTVTEHVKRIRKKLEAADPNNTYISTVWGVGYKWDPTTG
ncbi:DNA-binding response regulator [Rubrobacter xylanophilus]|uniref:DNA-binding response regulator n=1 Tax=Rubrobacter xylanophilus TaxID=49319 RepID=A0A510HHI1_9ACTN|nr:response regulator transcription factor [Rubrobacter xylanophilus]BBL79452.1 DNA-binding response regulator [Rubrobacter xylanophilus]